MEARLHRATEVLRAGTWVSATATDRFTVDHDARHRRRFANVAEGGTGLPAIVDFIGAAGGLRTAVMP